MREAKGLGKKLTYHCVYSNYSFDFWMVLHKRDAVHCGHRDEYRRQINAAYDTKFREMHEYKKEANFKKLLSTIGIDDIASAVNRAKKANSKTEREGARFAEHCGFTYCLGNPYTEIYRPIEEMLISTHALPGPFKDGH